MTAAHHRPLALALTLLALAAARLGAADPAPAPKPAGPPPLAGRFQIVRDRIKALYGNRDTAAPPFDPRHNPFRTQPVVSPEPPAATGDPAAPPATPNATLLKQASAQLKMTGFVERDGRTFLNINQALYKEGDVIKVTVQNQPVLLRITQLSRTSLTLALNDAETTLKF